MLTSTVASSSSDPVSAWTTGFGLLSATGSAGFLGMLGSVFFSGWRLPGRASAAETEEIRELNYHNKNQQSLSR
jgi:hypothetical protein